MCEFLSHFGKKTPHLRSNYAWQAAQSERSMVTFQTGLLLKGIFPLKNSYFWKGKLDGNTERQAADIRMSFKHNQFYSNGLKIKEMDDKYKSYLVDLIALLKQQAREAKEDADAPAEVCDSFNNGCLMGYHMVISLMKNQAFAFSIDQAEIGLDDIDPERDLL